MTSETSSLCASCHKSIRVPDGYEFDGDRGDRCYDCIAEEHAAMMNRLVELGEIINDEGPCRWSASGRFIVEKRNAT